MKSKVDQIDVDKLALAPADLSKLSDVAENAVVKRDVCDATITNIEDKMPDITNLATNTSLNGKIQKEIPSIT